MIDRGDGDGTRQISRDDRENDSKEEETERDDASGGTEDEDEEETERDAATRAIWFFFVRARFIDATGD